MSAIRFSHLRAFGRSPMHGLHARSHEMEETRDMERGTAVHAILFGNKKVCGYPGPQRRGKDYEAFAAAHPEHEILTLSEYEKAQRMADAVRANSVAAPLLNGVKEVTLFFPWMGLDCRATPDVRGKDYLVELKTSSTADPVKFTWHARRMCYHAQLKFQEYACRHHDVRIKDHWIICVESKAPHPVVVWHVEPEALEEGDKMLTLWAERMKACDAAKHYPGYVECALPLVWPKDDFDLEYEEAA